MIYPLRNLIAIKRKRKREPRQIRAMIEQEDWINRHRAVTDERMRSKEQERIEDDRRQYTMLWNELKQEMAALVREVFEQEERREAELRLTEDETDCLRDVYGAVCQAMDPEEDQEGKRWYRVKMP